MFTDDMHKAMVKGALYNLSPKSGASDEYCMGLVIGVVSSLITREHTYPKVVTAIRPLLPTDWRHSGVPGCWLKDFTGK